MHRRICRTYQSLNIVPSSTYAGRRLTVLNHVRSRKSLILAVSILIQMAIPACTSGYILIWIHFLLKETMDSTNSISSRGSKHSWEVYVLVTETFCFGFEKRCDLENEREAADLAFWKLIEIHDWKNIVVHLK